jgi:hypothetical protein
MREGVNRRTRVTEPAQAAAISWQRQVRSRGSRTRCFYVKSSMSSHSRPGTRGVARSRAHWGRFRLSLSRLRWPALRRSFAVRGGPRATHPGQDVRGSSIRGESSCLDLRPCSSCNAGVQESAADALGRAWCRVPVVAPSSGISSGGSCGTRCMRTGGKAPAMQAKCPVRFGLRGRADRCQPMRRRRVCATSDRSGRFSLGVAWACRRVSRRVRRSGLRVRRHSREGTCSRRRRSPRRCPSRPLGRARRRDGCRRR